MANNKSAEKRHRQSQKARSRNRAVRSAIRSQIKRVEAGGENAQSDLRELTSLIDRAVKKDLIHKNTAARKKSRLAKMINKKSETN